MKYLIKKTLLIALVLMVLAGVYFDWRFEQADSPKWGLNFSLTHAQYLGLDWKKMYLEMLGELRPARLRVMALWEVIEPEKDKFNFSDIDYILREAEKRQVKIILTLGYKQPGWPECHAPEWAQNMEYGIWNMELLEFITAVVEQYKDSPAISAWQVENEPFFVFGPGCPATAPELFAKEIALVQSLDPRPIVLTDSGEKGLWVPTARFGADIFGSTMYRNAYHHKWGRYLTYPIPAWFYRVKGGMLQTLTPVEKIIGVELQGEPWFITDVYQTPWEEQKKLMNAEILRANADYARRAGFAENYFWGVEWWYWAKEKQNDPELWNAAKEILNDSSP